MRLWLVRTADGHSYVTDLSHVRGRSGTRYPRLRFTRDRAKGGRFTKGTAQMLTALARFPLVLEEEEKT